MTCQIGRGLSEGCLAQDGVRPGRFPTGTERTTALELLVQELQADPNLWSAHRRAAQEALNGLLFEHLMRLRPPLVDADTAGTLADRLMEQARANHDRLLAV